MMFTRRVTVFSASRVARSCRRNRQLSSRDLRERLDEKARKGKSISVEELQELLEEAVSRSGLETEKITAREGQ